MNENFKFLPSHEWVKLEEDGTVTVGISDHAQDQLGDIVFVELPDIGDTVKSGDSFGTVEAVKTVAELYAPISGEVLEVNEALGDNAEILNNSPYDQGWIVKLKVSNPEELNELMNPEEYAKYIS